jgi:hypothetical protein
VKLKRYDGGMRRCKRLLRRKNGALGVCTLIGVWITYNDTKWQRRPQNER